MPGPGLPSGIRPARSNNNVDVIDHAGRRWLAWRTAPSHFASQAARLEVLNSDLGGSWRHEFTVALGRDIREPRFFSWGERLLMYAFEAGTNPRRFEPGRIMAWELEADGWSEARYVSPPGCVVWRVRLLDGRPVMSLYRGAETLFTPHPEPIRVELWTSDDGFDWRPHDPDRPTFHNGTETDFVETADGRVVYVCRKEGPTGGWGTDVGVATVGEPTVVRWRSFPRSATLPCCLPGATGSAW